MLSSREASQPPRGHEARGILTIKGQKIDVLLPFELDLDGRRATMSGSLLPDRRNFGIGDSIIDETTLGFWVQARIGIVAALLH